MPRPIQPLPSTILVCASRLVCSTVLVLLAGSALPAAAEGPAGALRAPVPGAIQRSLDSFASGWMGKLERAEAADRRASKDGSAGLTYTGYGDSFTTEIKSAGRSYLGLCGSASYI